MAMLRNTWPEISGSMECKPDYEKMIGETKERYNILKNLIDALKKYVEGYETYDKMSELIGELTVEQWSLLNRIDYYMKMLEKE